MSASLRIVVADDELEMCEYFQEVLPLLGHQVVAIARTGNELLQRCRESRPDLVISDIKMPDMDGIDAANAICRDELVPFILVSAYHDPELVKRAESDHIMAYLVKPIKQTDVGPAITIAMRRFEQFQTLRREATDLRQALEDRKIIERAKGYLMDNAGLSEQEAFRRLQKLARDNNQKVVETARMVLIVGDAITKRD